jgi:hypothetical protein
MTKWLNLITLANASVEEDIGMGTVQTTYNKSLPPRYIFNDVIYARLQWPLKKFQHYSETLFY